MRKRDDQLRDNLLEVASHIMDNEGVEAINIRSIAKAAGVASGTVYNYFSNKEEIVLSLTEVYWEAIMIEIRTLNFTHSFCENIELIYRFLKEKIDTRAGMLMRSLSTTTLEISGQEKMGRMHSKLSEVLVLFLEKDEAIDKFVWSEQLSKEAFIAFVISNLILQFRNKAENITVLLEIIQRVIYK